MKRIKGHVHADLMALYAEDAKTTDKPWELWQIHCVGDVWHVLEANPTWVTDLKYRRKPKTHTVNGVEVPDLRVTPKHGDHYYLANPMSILLVTYHTCFNHVTDVAWIKRGLIYQHSEEGRQAAILHSKAMLGIA